MSWYREEEAIRRAKRAARIANSLQVDNESITELLTQLMKRVTTLEDILVRKFPDETYNLEQVQQ